MNIENLQLGDIIFFENHYLNVDGDGKPILGDYMADRDPYIDHVAVYGGVDHRTNLHILLHSIEGSHTEKKPGGICQTSLRNLGIQSYEGTFYTVTYRVFRFNDDDFSNQLVEQARKWAQFNVPYDEQRLEKKFDLEESLLSYQAFVDNAKEKYVTEGKFRSIKFAARRETAPTRPKLNGKCRGLTCSMFIALLYQVVELRSLVAAPQHDAMLGGVRLGQATSTVSCLLKN